MLQAPPAYLPIIFLQSSQKFVEVQFPLGGANQSSARHPGLKESTKALPAFQGTVETKHEPSVGAELGCVIHTLHPPPTLLESLLPEPNLSQEGHFLLA